MRTKLSTLGRRRPLGCTALGLVLFESALAAGGLDFPALTALTLLAAPGLALVPLLPAVARQSVAVALAAVPAMGFAAAAVAFITLSSAGVALDAGPLRLTLIAMAGAGLLLLPEREPALQGPGRPQRIELIGLGAAVVLGLILQERTIGGSPVPGLDWAKYVLYADEIARQGSLLIDNPYWMLGMPFREDPATPALYGAYLELTGQPANVLAHGIWVFAIAGLLSTFALVRTLWGPLAGVIAAALWVVVPIHQDILGWHGLANVAALALLPLVLLYLCALTEDAFDWWEAAGFALLVVALAAAHRLSFGIGAAAIALSVLVMLLRDVRRRRVILRSLGMAAAAGLVLGAGVLYDLIERNKTFGGTIEYEEYLSTKLELEPVARDLTIPFLVAGLVATFLALRWVRSDRRILPVLCALAVTLFFTFGWILHIPLVYVRMAYFLPLVLAPLVALALVRLFPLRRAAVLGAVLVLGVGGLAWNQTIRVREFYGFLNEASLHGLDAVGARLAPGEVVVTDRCWSFLGTWLLHTPTLAALLPVDIQPKAELARAREAAAILRGSPRGRELARRHGVRFLLLDPTCIDAAGEPARPPVRGSPLYISKRLAVLELRR